MNKIQQRLAEQLEYFTNDFTVEPVGIFLYGSQNYNLSDADSDVDACVIFIPPAEDRNHTMGLERELPNGEMLVAYPLFGFYVGLVSSHFTMLELLFTEHYIINPKYEDFWNTLRSKREQIARISETQWYTHTLSRIQNTIYRRENEMQYDRDMINKVGYATKPRYHFVRMALLLEKYVDGKSYAEVLDGSDEAELLIAIKRGQYTKEEADNYADIAIDKINSLLASAAPAPDNLPLQRELFLLIYQLLK